MFTRGYLPGMDDQVQSRTSHPHFVRPAAVEGIQQHLHGFHGGESLQETSLGKLKARWLGKGSTHEGFSMGFSIIFHIYVSSTTNEKRFDPSQCGTGSPGKLGQQVPLAIPKSNGLSSFPH
jgi:hypothetical protein